FKAKGMGGAYIYCLAPGPYGGGPIPNGPAYLTPEWRDLLLINDQNQVGKQTASAAHIYGRKTASAESFTSFQPHWDNGPALLKPIADRAFCEGINRLVFHTMTSQRPQDGKPGYEFGAGTHFNPNVTWWQQVAGPWISYVSRCQALLQSGLLGPVRIMKGE
ncbi:MAG: glycosyl hydrolase, partial [bacterium]